MTPASRGILLDDSAYGVTPASRGGKSSAFPKDSPQGLREPIQSGFQGKYYRFARAAEGKLATLDYLT